MGQKIEEYRSLRSLQRKVEELEAAYSEDIFPDHGETIEQASAKMGRHICGVIKKYIKEEMQALPRRQD